MVGRYTERPTCCRPFARAARPRDARRNLRAAGRPGGQRDHHRPQAVSVRQRAPLRGRARRASGQPARQAELEAPEGLRDRRPARCRQPPTAPRAADRRHLRRPPTPAVLPASVPAQAGARTRDVTTAPGEDAGLELLGRAGMVAVQVADLAWPAGRGPGKDGRSALTAAGAGTIRGERYLARVDGLAGALALASRHGGQVPDQGGHHLGVVRAAPRSPATRIHRRTRRPWNRPPPEATSRPPPCTHSPWWRWSASADQRHHDSSARPRRTTWHCAQRSRT